MARKKTSGFDLNAFVSEMQDAIGGDIPWMASCEEDKWHVLDLDLKTMVEVHDCGPDNKWSGFRVDAHLEEAEETVNIEVPFWAMRPLVDFIAGITVVDGWAEFQYMRTFDSSGKNSPRFK